MPPGMPALCDECAIQHLPKDEPHDATSLFYRYRFFYEHGRWPTWADALAHVPAHLHPRWERELRLRGEVV